MEYIARWGNKGFCVTPDKIVPFTGFMTEIILKKDDATDTSGTPPTNTRGRELQSMSFSTTYLRSAGVDPRAQLEEWEGELGKSYPLYIGGKKFGPEKMMLTNVSVADLILSPRGDFLSVTLNITLQEDSEGGSSRQGNNGSGSTRRSASTGNNASAAQEASYNEAMRASPSASQKMQTVSSVTGKG